MRRLLASLAAAAGLWFAAPATALPAAPAADAAAEAQRVLVMLRLPPPHYRASGDYGDAYADGLGHSARWRIASRLAHDHGLTLVSDWPMPLVGVDCFVLTVPAGRSPAEAADQLSHDPAVAWAQPMNLYHAESAGPGAGDPLFRVQPAARAWRLADLHQIATGKSVRVAVVDSKIQLDHPDLAGQVELSRDFVPDHPAVAEAHGTGIAGVIAARADNGVGIAGVAPEARLLGLRACWQATGQMITSGTVCDSLSLAKAIDFAVSRRAQVINLSLSGPPDTLLGRLLDAALERGVTVVGAYDGRLPQGGFPASHAGVVAVTDESSPELASGIYVAPGRDVPTTQPGGRWVMVNGSSYAAAHVSGLFALLRERSSRADTAAALVAARGGTIDACASLLKASGPCGCGCARAPSNSPDAAR
ncbi:S8 family peptidase [Phenylobacterium montanum]|uniref:S8 family serine peptidase n=1 Tax=Phenylobacterium montanum TaxID=2823693 RepID=A0A975IWV7_9CAUL|nr:S8 family serine peptidase [Caulobacter sp. S6]QUD90482.1 S8 family serine peptidase [Caulobacter sp. S6]